MIDIKKLVILWVLLFLVSLISVFAEPKVSTTVESKDFKISSSKEVYYCKPVFSDKGCLIKVDFNIFSDVDSKLSGYEDLVVEIAFSHDKVYVKDFYTTNSLSKDNTLGVSFEKSNDYPFYVDVWAKKDGKFNVNIYDGKNLLLSLDPFINITTNATYPSYHLINGTVDVYSDDMFEEKIEISAGLSDNISSTNYTLRTNLYLSGNKSDGFECGGFNCRSGDWVGDWVIGGNGDVSVTSGNSYSGTYSMLLTGLFGFAIEQNYANRTFNVEKLEDIIISFYTYLSDFENGETASVYYVDNDSNELLLLQLVNGQDNSTWTYQEFAISRETYNTEGYNKLSFQSNINWDNDVFYIDDIRIRYNYTLDDRGMAVSVYFNHTLNTSKNDTYWLNIISNITHTANITVFAYLNDTHINTSSYVLETINSQNDFVDIMPIIYDGYNYPFRVSTVDGDISISDIFLYEQNEIDITPPEISNCSFNTTELSCGDYVRVSCKVTDDYYVDNVWFYGQHGNGTYQQMETFRIDESDYYYIDIQYTECFDEPVISTFIKANATDLYGNVGEFYPDITYTYTCICPVSFYCHYNPEPFLKSRFIFFGKRDRIDWLCKIGLSDASCLSEVFKDGVLLQTNPAFETIEGVGTVESFQAGEFPENYFRVWFNKENLLPEETFNFTVKCSAGSPYTFSAMVTPTYKDLKVVAYRGTWMKENMSYFILIIGIIIFALVMWRLSQI